MHYKHETLLPRFISQVDDERFFLDKMGKTNPSAELKADIKAFLDSPKAASQSEIKAETETEAESEHAQCVFPARWWWLKQQLNLAGNYDVDCPKVDEFLGRIAHDKLFLVFPSMYLNNPGSTFGHTFLRFDANQESILLSQTLNYAARIDKSDDLLSYVSKGLFGGYSGLFRSRPYFETVQVYSNFENRDIWEYQLAFSSDEIRQLVRHIWEVKGINFDYYFFRENCSYRLLALLDIIQPEIQLTGQGRFSFYAIPVDTVRALDDVGLIKTKQFRASLATQINDYFDSESELDSTAVLKIVSKETAGNRVAINEVLKKRTTKMKDSNTAESDRVKVKILNQSYSILEFYGNATTQKAQHILALTNELSHDLPDQISKNDAVITRSHKTSPDKGHDSVRLATGYGEQNSRSYIDIRFRPAFHDLLDAPQGYVDGAAINVFEARFKWFVNNDSSDNLRLESLSLFNVTSLNPLRRWRKSISWLFDFRFDRTQLSDEQSVRNFISRGGIGLSIKKWTITPFVLLMGEWNLSSSYTKGYSLLLGLQAGLQFNFKTNQFILSYENNNAVSGFELDNKVSLVQWQHNIQADHALRFIYKRTEYDFYDDVDWTINYNYYF